MRSSTAVCRIMMFIIMSHVIFGCVGPMQGVTGDLGDTKSVYCLELKNTNGAVVDFSRYRGKVLIIDLFTTWSQPSVVAMPLYGALYRKYRQEGLRVVAIGMDELGAKVLVPFAQGMQIDFPVVVATKSIIDGESVLGDIKAIPTLLVFDRSGRLKWVLVGLIKSRRLEKIIQDLL